MLENGYEFDKPKLAANQIGIFALLLAMVAIGIYWWSYSFQQRSKISQLKSENHQLRRSLDEAVSSQLDHLVSRPASSLQRSNWSRPRSEPGIDVNEFIQLVKSAQSEKDLDRLPYRAPNIAHTVQPLIDLASQPQYCHWAIYALRNIDLEYTNRESTINLLIRLIDDYQFGNESNDANINRHAYSFLVTLGSDAMRATPTLAKIMDAEQSPYSAYACVTLKMLSPGTEISDRLTELLESSFPTNRLIAARKITEFVTLAEAKQALLDAHAVESVDTIRQSIVHSIQRLDSLE